MNKNLALRSDLAAPAIVDAAALGAIRPLEREDLHRVAEIFLKTFRKSARSPSDELINYLDGLYLRAPWHRLETGSLVYMGRDRVLKGFMGALELHMMSGVKRLQAGVMGSFMVEDYQNNPRVGAHLLRTYLSGPQDIFFSDTANHISLSFAQKLGFEILPMNSMEWIKVLRPASLLAHLTQRTWRWLPQFLVQTLGHGLDRGVGDRFCRQDLLRREPLIVHSHPMEESAFLDAAPRLISGYALKPDWTRQELGWLIHQAQLKTKNGPLRIYEVHGDKSRFCGCYLMYAQSDDIAYVLQILPAEGCADEVMAAVLQQVRQMGCVAVRGAAQPRLMESLLRVSGLFYRHRAATVVRSSHGDVVNAVRRGEAFFGGLTGEGWTRLVSDSF